MIPTPLRGLPFWATREFRYLVMAMVVGGGAVAVMVFKFGSGAPPIVKERAPNTSGRPAWVADAPGTPREVRFDGVLDRVKDGTNPDDRGEPYGRLLRYLNTAETKAIEDASVFVDYPLFEKHGAELRGRTVRVSGLFLKSEPLRVARDGLGVEFIHRTWMSDLTGSEGLVVDLLEPPPAGVKYWSWVRADALFFKMTQYEGRQDQTVRVPMLVGKGLVLVREKFETSYFNLGTIVVALSVLSVVAVMYFSFRLMSRPRPTRILGTPVPKSER